MLVYGEVLALTKREGYCWASNQYLADGLKSSSRTISRSISNLAKNGYLRVEIKENYRRYLYVELFPKKDGGGQNCQEGGQSVVGVSQVGEKQIQRYNTHTNLKVIRKDKSKDIILKTAFVELYQQYPTKVGRKTAEARFFSTVKTKDDLKKIKLALKNYLDSDRVSKGFTQNASTWFNQWEDWVEFREEKKGKNNESELPQDLVIKRAD
jgi:biotin operon repressor